MNNKINNNMENLEIENCSLLNKWYIMIIKLNMLTHKCYIKLDASCSS